MLTDEIRLRILRELENDPGLSQRDLAKELGVSLGKTNYCLRALVEKGLVKVENFQKEWQQAGVRLPTHAARDFGQGANNSEVPADQTERVQGTGV